MNDIVNQVLQRIRDRDRIACPHCGQVIDMTDPERVLGLVTYYRDDEPVAERCQHCDDIIYIKEHVSRWWTVGRTPEEASDG